MSREQRASVLEAFDLNTKEGMMNFFVSECRNRAAKSVGLEHYLPKLIAYIRQGEHKVSQNAPQDSFMTCSGFGIGTAVVTEFAMSALIALRDRLGEMGMQKYVTGVPHIVRKPPHGGLLAMHHDKMQVNDLITNLRDHTQSDDPSVAAWTRKHGSQMLFHLANGDSGPTQAIAPMDCDTLLFCLEAIQGCKEGDSLWDVSWGKIPKDARVARDNYFRKKTGPYFLAWDKMVGKNGILNKLLRASGREGCLRVVDIRPKSDKEAKGPYAAVWPVGFPHGSKPNGATCRLSVTASLSDTIPEEASLVRPAKRLDALSILAHSGASAHDVKSAEAFFEKDTKPYSEGPTHRDPRRTQRLQSVHGWPPGPFSSLAPTPEHVDTFVRHAGWKRKRCDE